jgi:hypothetical protein
MEASHAAPDVARHKPCPSLHQDDHIERIMERESQPFTQRRRRPPCLTAPQKAKKQPGCHQQSNQNACIIVVGVFQQVGHSSSEKRIVCPVDCIRRQSLPEDQKRDDPMQGDLQRAIQTIGACSYDVWPSHVGTRCHYKTTILDLTANTRRADVNEISNLLRAVRVFTTAWHTTPRIFRN